MVNDLDLIVIIGFALEIIRRSPDFACFDNLATDWEKALRQYGPGVIDLKLEQFIATPDELRKFKALLSVILERTSQHDTRIPAQVLNELVSAHGVRFGDYSVFHVEEAVKRLQALVVHH